jgi:L-alanine-DL-glutamate epimerase-like enolase superfamily enzyme
MKITRITVWQKTLPLARPYWLSGGRLKFEALDSTFLRIDTDEGLSGWGEGCPWGHSYLPAFGEGLRAALGLLAPVLIDRDPRDIDALNRLMDLTLPGHLYAKSPLDMACWDILGQSAGLPLYALFGGAEGDGVPANSSISTGTPEEMVALVEAARAGGYRVHSAKIGGSDPALDIARIEAIEAARQADELVTYDVNRAWTPALAVEVMNAVAARGWFEQPCETLGQCVHVRRHTRQPILLDECLHGFQDHLEAWKAAACEGIKVKPNRVGGLTKARRLRDFGLAVGWRMHIEDVGGTVLADTAALHLALSTPAENRLGSWLCQAHLVDDPAPGRGARNHCGQIALPEAAGIGVAPEEAWLAAPLARYEGAAP